MLFARPAPARAAVKADAGKPVQHRYEIPDDLFAWEKSRRAGRLDLSNYKDLATGKAGAADYRPAASSFGERDFRASADWFSQYRFESLSGVARGTLPCLLRSEFEPLLEWTGKRGAVEKTQLKFGASFQRDRIGGREIDDTDFYLDDTYIKLKFGKLDVKVGNLIESLGTGDEISNLDVLNPRDFRTGLGSTSARAKIAVPCLRGDWYFSPKASLTGHLLPVHVKPKLADPGGVWATYVQRLATFADPVRVSFFAVDRAREPENIQTHVAFAIDEDDLDLRFHAFRVFEPLPVISRLSPTEYSLEYPWDTFYAVDGSVNVLDEFLLRGEIAYHPSRRFTSLHNGVIGESWSSGQAQILAGIDKTLPGELYFNIQGILSHITDFYTRTQMQQYGTEFVGTFRASRSFRRDLFKVELQALNNFTTEEFLLKPTVEWRPTDALEFRLGVQKNDGGRNRFGPIDQYSDRNHLFWESVARF